MIDIDDVGDQLDKIYKKAGVLVDAHYETSKMEPREWRITMLAYMKQLVELMKIQQEVTGSTTVGGEIVEETPPVETRDEAPPFKLPDDIMKRVIVHEETDKIVVSFSDVLNGQQYQELSSILKAADGKYYPEGDGKKRRFEIPKKR